MTVLTWTAFTLYLGGLALGALGVLRLRAAARTARERLHFTQGVSGPLRSTPAPTQGQVARAAIALATMLEDEAGEAKSGAGYLILALVVECAGNLMSIPWNVNLRTGMRTRLYGRYAMFLMGGRIAVVLDE
jgi:hypothetical protein